MKWIRRLMKAYEEYKYLSWMGCQFGDEEDTLPSGWWLCEYSWAIIRMHFCKHPRMENYSHITGDSGSEDFSCPDCGWTCHVCYY